MAGQPIPELRQEDPLLGVSTLATGIPDEPERDLELVEPSIGLPAQIPLIEPTTGPPATAALTPQPVPAPPRLASIPTIAPDVPIAPPVEVPRIAPAFAEAQATVQTLSAQQDDLRAAARGILHGLATESDPVKRAAREQQAEDNATAQQVVTADLNTARSISDTEEVVEAQRLGDAQAKLRQDAALRVREDSLAMDEANRASDAEALRQTDNVRQEATEAKERHVEILKRGPREPFAKTLAAMITEALQPLAFGREPDFNKAIDRLVASNRQAWQDEQAAAIAEIGTAGDAVGDIGRQERERKIQQSVIRESHIEQLVLELDREIATTTDEFKGEKARGVRDSLKREQAAEQARLDALARDKARRIAAENIKLRKVEADIALTGAKIGTERAKAIKAAAEAAKLARRGGRKVKGSSLFGAQIGRAVAAGQLDEKGAKLVFQQGVIDPVTGNLTTRSNGSFVLATSPKVAAELNESGARVANVNNLINEAISLRGAEGWEPTSSWFASDAGKRMAALSNELLLVNKDIFKLGVLSDGDIDLMKKIQGGDLAGLQDPRPVLRARRDKMIAKFNQRRKSLAPGSQKIGFDRPSEPKARTLQQTRSAVRDAFDPDTGSILSKETRFANVEEGLALLERERGSKTEAFQQTGAEIISYIGDEARGIEGKAVEDRLAIGDARAKARNEGRAEDHPDIVKLDKAFDEQVAFEELLRQRLPRFIKGVTEQEDLRARAVRGAERFGVGSTETALERTEKLGTAIKQAK